MPIVKSFGFTLNTDADTFCTWFEDRNRLWKLDGTSGATGGLVDIQEAKREQLKSRPKFCFDAVVEITEESEEWSKVKKYLFVSDWVDGKVIKREFLMSIMAQPGTHAGKVERWRGLSPADWTESACAWILDSWQTVRRRSGHCS